MALQWTAKYTDGTTLDQIDLDGNKSAYADIDRSKLEAFFLHPGIEGVAAIAVVIFDGDGEKLVWTRRVRQTLGREPETFHILGKKGEFILAVSEANNIVMARHNFVDDGLFYEVQQ